ALALPHDLTPLYRQTARPSGTEKTDHRSDGAQERTRTFTTLRPLAPEASASTNSATWAQAARTRPGRPRRFRRRILSRKSPKSRRKGVFKTVFLHPPPRPRRTFTKPGHWHISSRQMG